MTDIQIFNNPDFGDIRTVEIDGKNYFYGVDIAEALMYKRPRKAVSDNCKGVLTEDTIRNEGGYPELLIPEGDIYRLIIRASQQSNNKEISEKAEKFERWVMDEVLPAIRKNGSYTMPISTNDKIMLLAQGHMELQQEVDSIKKDMESLKMDLPILPVEEDRITSAVKRKGLAVMGGKTSNVYRDKSIRRKVYQGIYANLKYNFQIKTYRALKRSQVEKAIDIINNYQPPYVLAEQIDSANAQQTLIF